jgi:hypothetical protein
MRALWLAVAFVVWTSIAQANDYGKCMLQNAPALQTATDNSLDAIILSCIKLYEQPINDSESAAIKIQSAFIAEQSGGLVLIYLIYNGSSYDLTSITFSLKDKNAGSTELYRFNQFIPNYKGPGIVTGPPAPQYKRFLRTQTSGEYVFPLNLPEVETVPAFNEQYEVVGFTVRGIR